MGTMFSSLAVKPCRVCGAFKYLVFVFCSIFTIFYDFLSFFMIFMILYVDFDCQSFHFGPDFFAVLPIFAECYRVSQFWRQRLFRQIFMVYFPNDKWKVWRWMKNCGLFHLHKAIINIFLPCCSTKSLKADESSKSSEKGLIKYFLFISE